MVTVTLHNEAPVQGLPNEVIGSYTGSGLPLGTNGTWLTLYSPLGLRAATINGQRQGVSGGTELGVHSYSEYVDIPSAGQGHADLRPCGSDLSGHRLQAQPLQPAHGAGRSGHRERRADAWVDAHGLLDWNPGNDLTEVHTFVLHGGR